MIIFLAILVAVLLAAVASISLFLFLQWLAKGSILVTTVREGTVKAVMRGNSAERFLMSFQGYHLNDPSMPWFRTDKPAWEVIYHGKENSNGYEGEKTKDDYYDRRSWLLRYLGLYWVGWPWAVEVYIYQFEWNETYTDEHGKEQILPRAEATDFIYVSDFTYAIVTDGAETKDLLSTTEITMATVAIRNPYRALFSGEDWMRRITAAINRHARNFVGNREYRYLISLLPVDHSVERDEISGTEFSAPIIKLNERLPDDVDGKLPHGLRGRYGIEIRTADLQSVELSGEGKQKYQDAAAQAFIAEQEAKAIRTVGQADADVIKMKGEQEAASLQKRLETIKANGPEGLALAQLDALQESSKGSGNTIIWANDPLIAGAKFLAPAATRGDAS
jgi:hypothetical protein